MSRNLEYFTKFLANPASFRNKAFYKMVHLWADYIRAHQGEFNYLEDDEWKETRERLIADFNRREAIRAEFDNLDAEIEAASESDDDARSISAQQRWLEFMKKYRFEYNFTKKQIAEGERLVNKYIESARAADIAAENLRISTIKLNEATANLDDALAEHYERTGKMPVLTALHANKKHNGN